MEPKTYKTVAGDTLSAIAGKYGTSVDAIAKANNIADPNKIGIDMNLTIPSAPAPIAPTPAAPTTPARAAQPPAIVGSSDALYRKEKATEVDNKNQVVNKQNEITNLELDKRLAELKGSLQPATPSPAAPDYVKQYNELRASRGVPDVENELLTIKGAKNQLQEQFNKEKSLLSGEGGISQGFLSGQLSEKQKALKSQLDDLDFKERNAIDKLNLQNTYIKDVMGFSEKTYNEARQQFTDEYSKNVTLAQLAGTTGNQERDDARAAVTTLTNLISNSGKSWDQVDDSMKAQIEKYELQAGLVPGSVEAFARSKPKANLLSTSSRVDNEGNAITDFVYANEDGSPGIVKSVVTGTTTTSTGNKITLEEAKKNGLPLTTVGLSEQKVANDLLLDNPPDWFNKYALQFGPVTQDQIKSGWDLLTKKFKAKGNRIPGLNSGSTVPTAGDGGTSDILDTYINLGT